MNIPTTMRTMYQKQIGQKMVRLYLKGCDKRTVNEGDESGVTPLMIACLHGDLEVVEFLLKCGSGVNTECKELKNTPLHYTCMWPDILSNWVSELALPSLIRAKMYIAKSLLHRGAIYKSNAVGPYTNLLCWLVQNE